MDNEHFNVKKHNNNYKHNKNDNSYDCFMTKINQLIKVKRNNQYYGQIIEIIQII